MRSAIWILAVLCLTLSILITYASKAIASRLRWFDRPNLRSAHLDPTPRIGGIGIVLAFLLCGCLLLGPDLWRSPELAVLGSILAISALGLIEDVRGVSIAKRLAVQIFVATSLVLFLRSTGASPILTASGIQGAMIIAVTIFSIVWITNVYNFMDGIDGLAAGQAVIASLAVAIVAFLSGSDLTGGLMLLLACASMGFLVFNFPPATVFMGDVSSTAIGFAFATLPLLPSSSQTPIPVWLLAIAMFLLDATVTLVRRALHGEDIFQAHRSHLYQRPLTFGVGHLPIMATGWGAMLIAGACAIAWVGTTGWLRLFVACVPVIVFLALAASVKRMERRRLVEVQTLRAAEIRH